MYGEAVTGIHPSHAQAERPALAENNDLTLRRARTRERLLDAAGVIFAERGFDVATVEMICARAGFTRGAFYSNFSSKEELFVGLALRVSEKKLRSIERRLTDLKTQGLDLFTTDQIVRELLDVLLEERDMVLLINEFRTTAMRIPQIATPYLEWTDRMLGSVAAIIEDVLHIAHLRGRIPSVEIARHVIMTWDSVSSQAVIEGLESPEMRRLVTERVSTIARALVDGVGEPSH